MDDMSVVIDLPFPPGVNNLFANARGRGRYRTERYREWANAAGWELKAQKPRRVRGPVSLEMWFEDKRDRRRDLDGLPKAVCDLLVSFRIIEEDNREVVRELSLKWSRAVKGCRVCIRPAEAAA